MGTNILLQGLPKDIYTLINHYTDAKDIWDNVKMLLEGSELTKEDQESQLYDDFKHFRQHKGETIHDYYVRFTKLIDIRNIKMTMSKMQLNLKFVNNMLPEWGRFVIAVKRNRGLRDSNYDQLGQGTNPWGRGASGFGGVQNRVGNANRDKMLLMQAQENGVALDEEQLLFLAGGQDTAIDEDVDDQPVQDLALNVDNVFQADDCDAFDSDVDEALMAQTMFMANLSSVDPVNDEAEPSYDSDILSEYEKDNVVPVIHSNDIYTLINHYTDAKDIWDNVKMLLEGSELTKEDQESQLGQGTNPWGRGAAGFGGVHNRVGNANRGQARQVKCYNCNGTGHIARNCTQPKHPQNSNYYKDKMLLMQAQENGVALDEEQLLFLAGGQDIAIDEDVDDQPVQDLALNVDNVFQADDCDVFDSGVDEAIMAQTMFMANLSSADPVNDEAEPSYDSDILSELLATRTPYALPVQRKFSLLYTIVMKLSCPSIVRNTEDTLEIAEITRRKMNDKMKDPECVTHKVKISPHDYSKENFLATFTPQKQLTPEQIFWSHDLIKMKSKALKEHTTVSRPIKALTVYPLNTPATLVSRVLPMKSQVKIHIFTLIQLFLEFDKTCKKIITPTGLTEGERGFEKTKACYLKEVIPFFQTLKENLRAFKRL
nr:hypothetical protein [Tanacetum cinerariifolium]